MLNETENYIQKIEDELTRLKIANKDLRKNNKVLLKSISNMQSRISRDRRKESISPIAVMDIDENGNPYHRQIDICDDVYICQVCGGEIHLRNYCSKCGQRLQ